MQAIGGYFGLELTEGTNRYHDTPYATKSGRASLRLILEHTRPQRVYVPYYTCDTLLEPFAACEVNHAFYEINILLEPAALPELQEGEYFLYVNYFDLKRDTVKLLSEKYGDKLIADCTQAFFMKGNDLSWFFNSCRKFFGVPDGSYLYAPGETVLHLPDALNEDYETRHLLKRFNGNATAGYDDFKANELCAGRGAARMSLLSERLLSHVDYQEVANIRRSNFQYLAAALRATNKLALPQGTGIPMCYPYLPESPVDKSVLYSRQIFIPSLWPDVVSRNHTGFEAEKELSVHLLPLPVDHRYGNNDMETLVQAIKSIA